MGRAAAALAWALLLAAPALANDASRAAEGLMRAYNVGTGLADLFAPEILAVRDPAALEAWRVRTRDGLGTVGAIRYGRYLGQGQHLYAAEFAGGNRDLYLALDRQGHIAGLMLCEGHLMPLARPEDMRLCSGP